MHILIEYLLIIALQFIGVGFHVMQKVIGFGNIYPDKTKSEIFKTFWKEDWDTLVVSLLILALNLTIHFIIWYFQPELRSMEYYHPISFATAFMLGYLGQRKIYSLLGTAERYIDKKVSDKINV